jgi:DNA polymerase I-like protein with 3'-5' exonuclease and polymerase domains
MQFPIFPPDSDWTAPAMGDLPDWNRAKRVGIDLETCDPDIKKLGPGVRRDGFIAGYSFALEGGPAHYIPLRHLGGGNVDCEQGLRYLHAQLASFKGELVGANLAYDMDYLFNEVPCVSASRYSDVQVAAALLSSLHRSYSLARIAERLGLEGKDEGLLRQAAADYGNLDPKGEMWKLPARFVGPYATQDAVLPLEILQKQRRLLDEAQLEKVWKLESRLLPICVHMRARGVRVSTDRFEEIGRWCLAEEAKQLAIVKRETDVSIEVGETAQPALLDRALKALGIVCPRTRTGVASVKDSYLEALDLPATLALARARKCAKLKGTFVDGTLKHVVKDRIHATFKQMANDDGGARFGRMSCVQPNLQNQPAKDTELGDMLRSAYLPDEGCEWISVDYSAQEPRMLLHWATRFGCVGAQVAAEKFRRDPNTDSHRMMASMIFKRPEAHVTDKQRKQAKVIFLGLCYGMGSGKLAESLSLPTQRVDGGHVIAGAEAMRLLARFNEAVPYVAELDRYAQRQAKSQGFIRTLSGRICKFPLDDKGKYDWTRTALNRLIQGSSADQTKLAICKAWENGLPLQLPVHDEINMSGTRKQGRVLSEIMVDSTTLVIPSAVDMEMGPNWAAASEEKPAQVAATGNFWDDAQGVKEIEDKSIRSNFSEAENSPKPVRKEMW